MELIKKDPGPEGMMAPGSNVLHDHLPSRGRAKQVRIYSNLLMA